MRHAVRVLARSGCRLPFFCVSPQLVVHELECAISCADGGLLLRRVGVRRIAEGMAARRVPKELVHDAATHEVSLCGAEGYPRETCMRMMSVRAGCGWWSPLVHARSAVAV